MPPNLDARHENIGYSPAQTYNRVMTTRTIEKLLETANASPDGDTSVNVARRRFLAETDCVEFFALTRDRLFQIDEWNKNSSVTNYALFNDAGEEAGDGLIGEGRFIRIGLYGAGKYDWVRVISIVDETEEVVITVKPSHDPTQRPVDPSSISHFFGPEATNNFCLHRHDKTVALYVIGIDEKQNTR